jgi:hypothetical protein
LSGSVHGDAILATGDSTPGALHTLLAVMHIAPNAEILILDVSPVSVWRTEP